jgi:hypothetical protein
MIVNFKFFYEKSDTDYEEYNKLWNENKERFIFLLMNLSLSQQMSIINDNMNNNKNILAVRFPSINDIQHSKIINNILLGKGIIYDNDKIWYPIEVWLYSPFP